jgi:putative ABC transport system permease protein
MVSNDPSSMWQKAGPWMTSLALNLRIALRNLSRQRRRSLVAISSVAAGILALVVASGFMEWMFLDFREAMIHSQYSHLQITRPAFHEEGHAEPARYLMDQDVIIRAAAAALPMRTLTPRINLTGLVSKGETTQAFIGEGIDPAHDMRDDRGLALVAGRFLDPQDKTEIMLGKGLATLLGASVGDLVVLTVNTPAGGLSAREGRVAGIFTSVSSAYDER